VSTAAGPAHIALVGLPGVGKSTLAGKLAAELELLAVDLDDVIVRGAGRSVPDIFEREGEAGFRRRETEALMATTDPALAGAVIACGAGVVLAEENRRVLGERTRCVWLSASPSSLVARLERESGRPLLQGDVANQLSALAVAREPLYREVASITVDVTDRAEDRCLELVLAALA
jgi:shikimate kinase